MRANRMLRLVLLCGAVSPVLLIVGLLWDGATRDGYDQVRHGVSQLTSGDGGVVARLLFVSCGALLLAAVLIGSRSPRSALRWQRRLLGLVAVGLVIAGLFPTDPALGYPPGARDAVSVAGALHQAGGTTLFAGVVAAAVVAGRDARRHGRSRWAAACLLTAWAVAVLAVTAGVVFRAVQRGVIGSGPAGLLELASMTCALCWVTAAVLRDRPAPGTP
ncbi:MULTISPECIES: DUF998 domain-containing protein [Catenuloplanes]|uniref:DUF998 domain-containing protein n=1 Tax=Catenuloplanes niger TaxID=587534 RepID=A0AAE4CXQ0_9ACTN|nr:DUF998 domain-containing protein [Catenuloplanes niger]MDR7327717.1 hypothetical protein [Catenuloplanes niger]